MILLYFQPSHSLLLLPVFLITLHGHGSSTKSQQSYPYTKRARTYLFKDMHGNELQRQISNLKIILNCEFSELEIIVRSISFWHY